MKVLKVIFEIPLNPKSTSEDTRVLGRFIEDWKATLAENEFKGVLCTDAIVTRPGRD